jgi:EAL domain-containing protein (putative c-di-GMP-specific phosphodiesterase class I)
MSPTARLDDLGRRLVRQFDDAFTTSVGPLHIRASVGLAVAAPDDDIDTLLTAADTAMYAAKRQGKNRYAVYDAVTQNSVFDRLEILEDALRDNRIEVHYQPIVDINTGGWRALEALVRCRTEDGELLSPATFLPVAEDTGLMETIDRTVMSTAVNDLVGWRAIPGWEDLTVSINVSARALHAPDFETFVVDTLQRADVPPRALAIELTEAVHVTDPERSASLLQRLRERGIRVALDDFGTGYSGLAYLTQLPLDAIKIPMEFTSLLNDDRARELVHTVMSIGRTINAVTVAEGIETEEQWQQLRAIGCEAGQGYLFARPQPATQIRQRLIDSRRAKAAATADRDVVDAFVS